MELFEFGCFAGACGGLLGSLLDGRRIVGAIEKEAYRRAVLLQRQQDKILPWFPVWDDVCTFRVDNPECTEYIEFLRSIKERLVISGGFPCQDISTAGRGAGIDGDRSGLFFEFARIVGEVRPRYWFMENSPALLVRGFDRVLGEISKMGYNARWCVVGADNAGAPHVRKRIWILAYTAETQRSPGAEKRGILSGVHRDGEKSNHVNGSGETLADRNKKRLEKWEGIPRNSRPLSEAVVSGGTSTPQTYPTPTSSKKMSGTLEEWGGSGNPYRGTKKGKEQLNPDWVEWLMGWPIGWSALKPLETGKYRRWLQSHGES